MTTQGIRLTDGMSYANHSQDTLHLEVWNHFIIKCETSLSTTLQFTRMLLQRI